MPPSEEERAGIAESVEFTEESDELRVITVRLADLIWDEDPGLGRAEMTGAWLLSFRDSLPDPVWLIDLPHEHPENAEREARRMVAARLMGDADLSDGQPHVKVDSR